MKEGRSKDVLGKLVAGLVDYTVIHFTTEETYFYRFGYTDTDNHIKEYEGFVKKVSDIQERFEKGQISLSIEIMNFLKDWLQKHVKGTDKKYSQFFNENGLS